MQDGIPGPTRVARLQVRTRNASGLFGATNPDPQAILYTHEVHNSTFFDANLGNSPLSIHFPTARNIRGVHLSLSVSSKYTAHCNFCYTLALPCSSSCTSIGHPL
jgi:hypothetical protein